jgi:hypothetical protein
MFRLMFPVLAVLGFTPVVAGSEPVPKESLMTPSPTPTHTAMSGAGKPKMGQ